MDLSWTKRLDRKVIVAMATLALLLISNQPFNPHAALAQDPAQPPDLVDWQVDRTPEGVEAFWEFSPQVHVYLNLYQRADGVNVASQDLGTGTLRGSGVYRYVSTLSTPTVSPDQEYTLDVVADDIDDPTLTWRFTFIVPKYGEGGGFLSDVSGWLRGIRESLNPLDWTTRFFAFGVATAGRGINQFLCDAFSWASGGTPDTCVE